MGQSVVDLQNVSKTRAVTNSSYASQTSSMILSYYAVVYSVKT